MIFHVINEKILPVCSFIKQVRVGIYLKSPLNIAKAGKAIFKFIGDTDKKVKTWPVSDLLAWYCVCYPK